MKTEIVDGEKVVVAETEDELAVAMKSGLPAVAPTAVAAALGFVDETSDQGSPEELASEIGEPPAAISDA